MIFRRNSSRSDIFQLNFSLKAGFIQLKGNVHLLKASFVHLKGSFLHLKGSFLLLKGCFFRLKAGFLQLKAGFLQLESFFQLKDISFIETRFLLNASFLQKEEVSAFALLLAIAQIELPIVKDACVFESRFLIPALRAFLTVIRNERARFFCFLLDFQFLTQSQTDFQQ